MESIPRTIVFDDSSIAKGKSFRQLLMPELTTMPWAKLGINLLLGVPADKVATPWDYMYLPKHLQTGFKYAGFGTLANLTPFAKQPKMILDRKPEQQDNTLLTPILVFLLVLVIAATLSYFDIQKSSRNFWFDRILLFTTGLLGVLFAFLWLGTAHRSMAWNLNLLWANPFNLFIAFVLTAKRFRRWVGTYLKVNLWILVFTLVFWFIIPQTLPVVILPAVIALAIRMYSMKRIL